LKIRSRFLTRVLAAVAVVICKLIFLTCRKRWRVEAENINPYTDTAGRRHLYCVWHDQILTTVFFRRPRRVAALVSRHQDGSYLADAMQLVGITPVRGSSSRGGAKAMRQMLDAARELHVVITPDGPRGPRRQVKDGIVFLASHSGRAIVPSATACRRGWRIRGSWTELLIPRPFTTVFAIGGTPLEVARLQQEMERLDAAIQRWAGGDEHAAQPPQPGESDDIDLAATRAA
jgi:lysophospholipid acyltransferase (LPLAT)-like uncharacterized protein